MSIGAHITNPSSTLAGLGFNAIESLSSPHNSSTDLPSMRPSQSLPLYLPSSKQCEFDARGGITDYFTSPLPPISESPPLMREESFRITIQPPTPELSSSHYFPNTLEDRSDPLSQFADFIREWNASRRERGYGLSSYMGDPSGSTLYSNTLYSASEDDDLNVNHHNRNAPHLFRTSPSDSGRSGESYYASCEADDEEDDDSGFDGPSFILPHDLSIEVDTADTTFASSSQPVLIHSPASSGTTTRALGSFSDVQLTTPNAPRLESAPFPWVSQLPTVPGDEIQIRFNEVFDENGRFRDVNEEDDHLFISSYSSSSDSCPPSPPLSDDEGNEADRAILGGLDYRLEQ